MFIAGGKGKTSRKTPDEILDWGQRLGLSPIHTNNLIYNSRMSAKVDSSLVQDGYQIYHHAFFFSNPPTGKGAWTVVQQGMNTKNSTARRYHWYSENIEDLVVEPHSGIATQIPQNQTLNLTSKKSSKTRQLSTKLVTEGFETLLKDMELLRKHYSKYSKMMKVRIHLGGERKATADTHLRGENEELIILSLSRHEFKHHPVEKEDFWDSPYLKKIFEKLNQIKPESYEKLLATEGVGPKTVRALSLVSEIIYGADPSYEDPARYSFAHGGKDGTPYPVDKPTYDQTIEILRKAVAKTKISPFEKDKALKRLIP